jgi:hypothetical protein
VGGFFGGLAQVFVAARFRFGGLDVDLLRKFGELLVGFLFFLEGLFEEGFGFGLSQQTCPGPYGTIGRNFVMFDALRGGNERCIFHAAFEVFIHKILAFLDESDHRSELLAAGLFAESFENLIERVDVPLGLFKVFFESGAKLLRVCSLGCFTTGLVGSSGRSGGFTSSHQYKSDGRHKKHNAKVMQKISVVEFMRGFDSFFE